MEKLKRYKGQLLITGIVIVVMALTSWLLWFRRSATLDTSPKTETASEEVPTQEVEPSRIRLIASGDILPHETVTNQAKEGNNYDYQQFFSEVRPIFQGADIRFCNQEALSSGEQFGLSSYPTFNAPTQFASDLSAVGCNLISLANNHMNDKGQAAINKTLDVWDGLKPLAHAGANQTAAEQSTVRYFDMKGVRFAFAAYAEYSNNQNVTPYGVNILSESLVRPQLIEARQKADVVLVSVHWGTEYSATINSNQEKWAKIFADLGADVVIGTGPHVLEPVKRLPKTGGGETLVWYSLGNILSSQLETESLIGGFAVMDFDPATKKMIGTSFLPTYMHYEWTAQEKARDDLLQRKNLKIYPLDKAAEPLARSLNNTTVADQTARIKSVLNTYTEIPIISSPDY